MENEPQPQPSIENESPEGAPEAAPDQLARQVKGQLTPSEVVAMWRGRLKRYEEHMKPWLAKAKAAEKRFSPNTEDTEEEHQEVSLVSDMNVFRSNVRVLQPAVYARRPVPIVKRRFNDDDPLARIGAQALERALKYLVETEESFNTTMQAARDSALVPGRGQVWLRYVPLYVNSQTGRMAEVQLSPEAALESGAKQFVEEEQLNLEKEEKYDFYNSADVPGAFDVEWDLIPYQDFYHDPVRQWRRVKWTARRVWHERSVVAELYPEILPLVHTLPAGRYKEDSEKEVDSKEAKHDDLIEVFEIWCKTTRKVYHIVRGFSRRPLRVIDDPLNLVDFFPCPRPLTFQTEINTLLPITDYSEYSDQDRELSRLQTRIVNVMESIRCVTLFNAAFPQLQEIYDADLEAIPIPDYDRFVEKGGVKANLQAVDNKQQAEVLQLLYNAQRTTINIIYELTGLSDIVRGSSDPNETATAQQLKGRYANMRLEERQKEMQRFVRDSLRIGAEIVVEHFASEYILEMVGDDWIDESEAMEFAEANPEQPNIMFAALELLRDDVMREFNVQIETDSTLAVDEQAAKQEANEFVQTFSMLLERAMQAVQAFPMVAPLVGEVFSWTFRRFRAGREAEPELLAALESLNQEIKAMMEAPPPEEQGPPPPTPEEQIKMREQERKDFEAQHRAQIDELKIDNEQMKIQIDALKAGFEMARQDEEVLRNEEANEAASIQLGPGTF